MRDLVLAPEEKNKPVARVTESSALTLSRRATARAWRRSSANKTVAPRPALSARAATSVAARAWEPSIDGALGSPPGASRATVSGAARYHCVREGRKGGSDDDCGGYGRGLTWPWKAFKRVLRDRPRGDSPSGANAESGANEGVDTHLISSSWESSVSSFDEYALSSEWAMSRVTTRVGRHVC